MAKKFSVSTTSRACAVLLVACGVVILTDRSTHAADECLAAPNAPTPPGSHWYYRLELPTQRKCWYVGQVHSISPKISTAAKPRAAPATKTAVEQSTAVRQADEQSETPTPPESVVGDTAQAGAFVVQAPDPPTTAIKQERTAIDRPPAQVQFATRSADAGTGGAPVERSGTTTKESVASATFVPPRMLLLVLAALALAGVLGRAIFSLAFGRRQGRVDQRSPNWGADVADERVAPNFNTIVASDRVIPQIEIPDDLKKTLRQVLQSLEVQAA
jgi:hypothetical protein